MIENTTIVMSRVGGLIDLAAANAAPSGARQALVYLALVAALLGLFVFSVALITALRRRARRDSRKPARPAAKSPGAWEEAGRRIEP
jgi:hypothetical protein